MPPIHPHSSAEPKGFVLISVVVFVLIITIIGLSMFSMGGFEAGFVGQDLNHSASYLTAKGALVRARFILETTADKNKVRTSLPAGITRAVAWQDGDSTLPVIYLPEILAQSHPVRIDVTAQVGNSRRTLSGLYVPVLALAQSLNMIANRDSMKVGAEVSITGPVRQSSNDLSWMSQVTGLSNPPDVQVTDVHALDINGFMAAHAATAQGGPYWANGDWNFNGGFYLSQAGAAVSGWAFYDPSGGVTTVSVRGYNVWLVESGFKFHGAVRFVNAGSATDPGRLVIVSEPGGPTGDYGARFYGGIQSSDVPIALVTDGRVVIGENANVKTNVGHIAIFSNGIELHHVGLSFNATEMDSVLLNLQLNGLYPGALPGTLGVLTPVPAGWVDMNTPLNN